MLAEKPVEYPRAQKATEVLISDAFVRDLDRNGTPAPAEERSSGNGCYRDDMNSDARNRLDLQARKFLARNAQPGFHGSLAAE